MTVYASTSVLYGKKCYISFSFYIAIKGVEDLENFNVKVFYDKLEDQNLHMASQLAKQQEDLKSFYKKICDQNEELKHLLKSLDPAKLEELERKMAERAKREEGMQKSAGDVFNIVNGNVNMGGAGKYRFAGERCFLIGYFIGFLQFCA